MGITDNSIADIKTVPEHNTLWAKINGNECGFVFNFDANAINVDTQRQRREIDSKVNAIAADFNISAFGSLVLSMREDGKYYVMDGRQRWAAARKIGVLAVPCMVFVGLTLEQEADIFIKCNTVPGNGGYNTYIDMFLVRLSYDPQAQAVYDAVIENGYDIQGPGDKRISALDLCDRIVREDCGDNSRLRSILRICSKTFENDGPPTRGIISGLDLMMDACKELDEHTISARLKATASEIKIMARKMKEAHGGATARVYALSMTSIINSKSRFQFDMAAILGCKGRKRK